MFIWFIYIFKQSKSNLSNKIESNNLIGVNSNTGMISADIYKIQVKDKNTHQQQQKHIQRNLFSQIRDIYILDLECGSSLISCVK